MSRYISSDGRDLNLGAVIKDTITAMVVLILLWSFWPLRTVPTGHRGVITVGGAINGIKSEGFTLIWPWETLNVFNVRAEEANVDKASGGTLDLQPVTVSVTVRYSVMADRISEVFEKYSRSGNLDSYIATAAQDVIKDVTSKYTAPGLIAQRSKVSADITAGLRLKMTQFGALVVSVDMRNFDFDPAYMQAINAKATEEQKKFAAENQVKTVEAQQRAKVVTAEADAEALRKKADGEAYATLKRATAEADSLKIQNAALRENKDVLELRRIEVLMKQAEQWNGALPSAIYSGAPIPFMGGLGTNERPR